MFDNNNIKLMRFWQEQILSYKGVSSQGNVMFFSGCLSITNLLKLLSTSNLSQVNSNNHHCKVKFNHCKVKFKIVFWSQSHLLHSVTILKSVFECCIIRLILQQSIIYCENIFWVLSLPTQKYFKIVFSRTIEFWVDRNCFFSLNVLWQG